MPGWGSVARKGARHVTDPARGGAQARLTDPGEREIERWVRIDGDDRKRSGDGETDVPAEDISVTIDKGEVLAAAGQRRASAVKRQVEDAAREFATGHYDAARSILRPVVKEAPALAVAQELYGLTMYRLGRWKPAATHLDLFRQLTQSTEQNPVLADCYRALGRYTEVQALWEELKEASPSGDLVTEGRIVAAGAIADQGDLSAAINLLAKGWRLPKHPKDQHLRRAYALADLYERAGDLPKARELFARVARLAPGFGDAEGRVQALE